MIHKRRYRRGARFVPLAFALAFALTGCITPTTDPERLPAGQWRLDRDHASAVWSVRHLGLSRYTARFDRLDATLDFDPSEPEAAELTAIIEAGSISTGDPDFDDILRGGSWFAAERHPQIIFRSERVEITGENRGRAFGALTLKGVTAPAVMEVEFYGGAFNFLENRQVAGFGADLTVNRSTFGIGNLPPAFVGEEVDIRIEAEFLREGDA